MRRGWFLPIALAALVAGCGGDSEDEGGGSSEPKPATNASSIECLTLSTLSPELIKREDAEADEGPFLTPGAKGAAILTGRFGALVFEYPDENAAEAALENARELKAFKSIGKPQKVTVIERTLFVDFTGQLHVGRAVEACARNPDPPPPTG